MCQIHDPCYETMITLQKKIKINFKPNSQSTQHLMMKLKKNQLKNDTG